VRLSVFVRARAVRVTFLTAVRKLIGLIGNAEVQDIVVNHSNEWGNRKAEIITTPANGKVLIITIEEREG
jgi:hypothetical protein